MGWEVRGNSGRRYYTRSRKRFGRVEREYVGCGSLALVEAGLDDLRRRKIAELRLAKHKKEEWLAVQYRQWQDQMAKFVAYEDAVLARLGFHYHRGQLRFRRMNETRTNPVWGLIRQANQGYEVALRGVIQELQGSNREVMLERVGDLARQCETAALRGFGDQPAMEIIVREKMQALRTDLAPSNVVESLIVQRIVQLWLQLHLAELAALSDGEPSKASNARLESLSRRYLQALKTLALVRKRIARATRTVTATVEV